MHHDEHAITIWVDGSSKGTRDNGLAGVIQYPDDWNMEMETIFQEAYDPSNIFRMELQAVIRALEYVRKRQDQWRKQGIHRIRIASDSQSVVNNVNNVPRWIKDKGRGAEGQPIANMPLWKKLNSLRRVVPVEIGWHPRRSTPQNKAVDTLAKAARKGSVPKRDDRGFVRGKVARSPVGPGPTIPYPAHGDTAVIKVFYYGPADSRMRERKVKFSVMDSTTGQFSGKYYAYGRNLEVTRKGLLDAVFGDNPKYPMIESLEPRAEEVVSHLSHSDPDQDASNGR